MWDKLQPHRHFADPHHPAAEHWLCLVKIKKTYAEKSKQDQLETYLKDRQLRNLHVSNENLFFDVMKAVNVFYIS